MTALSPGIITLGDYTLGSVDAARGVKIGVNYPEGWHGKPKPTAQATQRTRANGAWVSANYAGTRHVALSGWVKVTDPTVMQTVLDELNAAVPLSPVRMTVTEYGVSRFVDVESEDELITSRLRPEYAEWSAQLMAVNGSNGEWRKFGTPLVASTSLPSISGGFTSPFTSPFTSTAVSNTGTVALDNPGNEIGPVTLRIDGPVSGPIITHVSSGLSLVFSSSLTLGVGEWLDVDMEKQTVLANGQATRAGWVVERGWSGFDPASNVWAFTAPTYSPDARLTVTAIPAWL